MRPPSGPTAGTSATNSMEKMAAVLGVSNPEVYADFRGETLAQFLATRKVPMRYSVAGGEQVRAMDQA